jgi:hypothetical protein
LYKKRISKEKGMSIRKIIPDRELLKDSAQALLSAFRDSDDPKYVGPGTWNVIHRLAFLANTPTKQQEFVNIMKQICHGFPCLNCREHCTEYIRTHPLEEYLNVAVSTNSQILPLGLFVWSWRFHNEVNKRLKKPLMAWKTAINLYSPSKMYSCNSSCSASDDEQTEEISVVTSTPVYTSVEYY